MSRRFCVIGTKSTESNVILHRTSVSTIFSILHSVQCSVLDSKSAISPMHTKNEPEKIIFTNIRNFINGWYAQAHAVLRNSNNFPAHFPHNMYHIANTCSNVAYTLLNIFHHKNHGTNKTIYVVFMGVREKSRINAEHKT